MLRTKQILDNSKYTQESNSVLGLSGKTQMNDISISSSYSLDKASATYTNQFLTNKFKPKVTSLFDGTVTTLPKSDNLINIHPIFDNQDFTISQTVLVLGIDGENLSEIYKLDSDINLAFTGTRYTKNSVNYSGDTIPDVIAASIYVPQLGSIYYIYTKNDGLTGTGLGHFNLTGGTNTLYTSTSGNYTGDLIENGSADQFITSYNDNGTIYLHFIFNNIVHRFNASTKTNVKYSSTSGNYSGSTLTVYGNYVLQHGNYLYVCLNHFFASNGGIWKLDLITNAAVRFTNTSTNYNGSKLQSNSVRTVIVDNNNDLWFEVGNGLWRYVESTNTGTMFNSTSGNFTGDSFNSTSQLRKLDSGVLVFFSSSNLFEFNPITLTSVAYKSSNITLATYQILGWSNDFIASYPNLQVFMASDVYILGEATTDTNKPVNGMFSVSRGTATNIGVLQYGDDPTQRYFTSQIPVQLANNNTLITKQFLNDYFLFGNGFKTTDLFGYKVLEVTGITATSGGTGTVTGGTITGATNGLVKTGYNIGLGGNLTRNTYITLGNENIFAISGNSLQSGNDYHSEFSIKTGTQREILLKNTAIEGIPDTAHVTVFNNRVEFQSQHGSIAERTYMKFEPNQTQWFYDNDQTGNEFIFFITSGGTVYSDSTGKGIRYTGNYSSTFTKHSLVDKHYVTGITSQIQGGSGGTTTYPDANTNIVIGESNLTQVTDSYRNVAIGYGIATGTSRTVSYNNLSIGNNIGNADNFSYSNSIDIGNDIAFHAKSLDTSTIIPTHIAIGNRVMYNLSGNSNSGGCIAIGFDAMYGATAKGGAIAIGSALGGAEFEHYTIAIGSSAGSQSVTGRANIFIGVLAGASMTGGTPGSVGFGTTQFNVAIGTHTLENGSGEKGTFVGCEAGSIQIRGQANSAFGNWSLPRATGNYNNGLGSFAGYHASLTLTGSTNTFIGWRSGYSTASLTNTIVLAHNYEASLSNRVYLGATTQKVILTATPTSTGTSNNILVRNSTSGEIETRTTSSLVNGIAWKTTGTTTLNSNATISSNAILSIWADDSNFGEMQIGGKTSEIYNKHFYFASNVVFYDNTLSKTGLLYGGDYSSGYTNRSLVDKEYNDKQKLRIFTVAGVPSAATEGVGTMIFVTDEIGGSIPAFSDGTNWRRVSDRAIISV